LKELTLDELGKLEVTTYQKMPSEIWQTPAAVFVITGEDILRSGATNIADALRLAPGVEVGRISSTTWAVGIRGLENNFSKSVLVLIDGRNVYTPLFAGVYWDVQDMPLDDIDRIEVIRGPGGTIWGPNAANGVVNIITKKAGETPGVMADALVGTVARTIDDLQVGAAASRQISFRVFGRGLARTHEFHTDGINYDEWHQERGGFRAGFVSGRDTVFAEADAYRGNTPHLVTSTPLDDHVSGGDVNLRWQRMFSDVSGFYVQAYFERTLRTNRQSLGETRNTIDIDFIHHFPIGHSQQFTYGGGLRWSPYRFTSPIPTVENLIPNQATDHVHTGFAQDEFQLSPNLSFTVGGKFQHNNRSGFDVQPTLRLRWSPGERQSLWFAVTRAVTTPSDLEENFFLQGQIGPGTVIQVLGGRHFKSEDLIGYEGGYRVLANKRFFVDLSLFRNQYTNLQSFSAPQISTTGGITTITIQYENKISGHTSGAELATKTQLATWWHFDANYSFLSPSFRAVGPTSDISSSGSVATYEGSAPRHMVGIQSKVDLPAHFQFDQMYRYASALPAQEVRAYQTMDLRLARAFCRHVLVEAVGQNLFQPRHAEWGTGDPAQANVNIARAAYLRVVFHSAAPRTH